MNNHKYNKFDIDSLSHKLDSIHTQLNEEKNSFKKMVTNISKKDKTNVSKEILYSILDEDEKHYHIINEEYKELVSRFSLAYVEMSEWYCGPELPIDVYNKIYKKSYVDKKIGYGTYLDSKEDVKELYKLFAFMFLFESYITRIN